MEKEFYRGLILGLIVGAIVVFILIYYAGEVRSKSMSKEMSKNMEKNYGCREYLNQTIPCSDWTKINFDWEGKEISFKDLMSSNYNCTDENCARRICGCPGY